MANLCEIPPITSIKCGEVRCSFTTVFIDKNGNAFDKHDNYLGVAKQSINIKTGETFWTIEQDDNIFKSPVNNR